MAGMGRKLPQPDGPFPATSRRSRTRTGTRANGLAFTRIMRQRLFSYALFVFLSTTSYAARASNGLEGHWENPKHTTVVDVRMCGQEPEYCAVVLKASAKTQENARKGGTMHFIGTEILRVHPAGEGAFRGTAFDPESNRHVDATVRMVGPGIMELRGCAMMGLVCQEQVWTKVNSSRNRSFRRGTRRPAAARG